MMLTPESTNEYKIEYTIEKVSLYRRGERRNLTDAVVQELLSTHCTANERNLLSRLSFCCQPACRDREDSCRES
jgi:hypothetical protein